MRPEPVEGPPTPAGRSVPVIGLAHGSRHAQGAEAIERLMAALDAPDRPARHAFLDLAEPDLNAVVGEAAAAGHRRIVVVPLLFTVAFHATIDVPQAVVRAAAEHAGVELEVADILEPVTTWPPCSWPPRPTPGWRRRFRCCSTPWARPTRPPTWRSSSWLPGWNAFDLSRGFQGVVPLRGQHVPLRSAPRSRLAAPGLAEVLDQLGEPVAILPLFLADGRSSTLLALAPAMAGRWSSRWGSGPPTSCWSATAPRSGRSATPNQIGFLRGDYGGARRAALPADGAVRVSAAKIAEFARALGDDNPAYAGDAPIAPPTFAA